MPGRPHRRRMPGAVWFPGAQVNYAEHALRHRGAQVAVRFEREDGTVTYYATYTAYDGFSILPQLMETHDFVRFRISTLNGSAAQNKGMALFPRLIRGKYVMLSRKDRENLFLATSSDVRRWDDVVELYRPQHAWELLQIGNVRMFIDLMNGFVDQAELDHGAIGLHEARIGCAAAGGDRGLASRDLLHGGRNEIGQRSRRREKTLGVRG